MKSLYLPEIPTEAFEHALASEDKGELYDLLVQPLHEELYRRQDFTFLDDLSEGQQLMLTYDYVQMQVMQGGFIQLIQNGYIGLLPQLPGWLQALGDMEMAQIIDDVLKVYVLNREMLDKKTTVEEFAQLYNEFKEFEALDERFRELNSKTNNDIVKYASTHIEEFAKLV
ncbi:MAG: hypothetical protein BGO70_17235 [Bacteroidetes bacterium 43-93]|jgi:hypothetical protein|nr:DUF4375 domain-containing protein [Bacteroidota bacterium]MBS1780641.1 DUF4375 domain-containing protein [Bacteroidota bacterium]OJX01494.1 MAG: hypothetical protein BGO70_17235 [Bacteroidetes bacterium 43-93]